MTAEPPPSRIEVVSGRVAGTLTALVAASWIVQLVARLLTGWHVDRDAVPGWVVVLLGVLIVAWFGSAVVQAVVRRKRLRAHRRALVPQG